MKPYLLDTETMVNCFLFVGKQPDSERVDVFEISSRKNERSALLTHLNYLQNAGFTLVGFNNLGFDYPVIHELLNNPFTFTERTAYLKAQEIISQQNAGFRNTVRINERFLPQVDLYKINHFDNRSKTTSLKALQFAMRLHSVDDLPYSPHEPLTPSQMDELVTYCIHDVMSTESFYNKCKHLIDMRQELQDSGVLTGDVLNYSDVKIGTEYLIRKIGRAKCFVSGSTPRQTVRDAIPFNSIILRNVWFRTEPFKAVLTWFKDQTLITTAETKPKLEVTLAGLKFDFGIGGVHASVESKSYRSSDTHVIKDVDVSGMYPAVAIANGFYPEHLGQDFTNAYRQLQSDRRQYPKGTAMNAVLKLAGNGAYGNSNNMHSCFYDPRYTFSVTVNGQLQLLQLVEVLSLLPGLEIIQANTDGVTVYMPREIEPFFDMWCKDWEQGTGLKLEEVTYKAMWIKDVNNYFSITTDGKMKRKGCFWYPETDKDYDGVWNKDFSAMVVQKAVELVLTQGVSVREAVRIHTDPFDFMLRYKAVGSARVMIGDKECSKTVRYYVSSKGEPMKKIAKPKGEIGHFKRKNGITDELYNRILSVIPKDTWDERIHNKRKSRYEIVTTSIESGNKVRCCNVASEFNFKDVEWEYYESEVRKLII